MRKILKIPRRFRGWFDFSTLQHGEEAAAEVMRLTEISEREFSQSAARGLRKRPGE